MDKMAVASGYTGRHKRMTSRHLSKRFLRDAGARGRRRSLHEGERRKQLQTNTRQPWRYEIFQWCLIIENHLPPELKSLCVDVFYRYMPISLIRLISTELDGYFKLRMPQSGEVVVDAGAWKGHIAIVAARLVGPRGKVVAIEPQKVMSDRLKSRMTRLGLKNVTVVNSALFDCTSELAVAHRNDQEFNVFSRAVDTQDTELVTLRTLDDILDTLGVRQVNFIKMDIEGAELEALSGMRATLSSMHPFLAIASYHWREGTTTSSRVEEILRSYNYSCRTGHPWHLTTWGWDNADQNGPARKSVGPARDPGGPDPLRGGLA
jgi:FkbM family methyltransferase